MKTKKAPKILIFGENWCPYCKGAKSFAKKINPQFDFKKDFITGKTPKQLKQFLKLKTMPRTIPIVVVNGKYIGGYSDLQRKFPL